MGGQVIVGRIRGIERPPLAPLIPTADGVALLIDCGANVDAKPEDLVLFARLGSLYVKNVMQVERPRVGLLNIGTEEAKGNALTTATFPLLKACGDLNFVGNIESREIPAGAADVVVSRAGATTIAEMAALKKATILVPFARLPGAHQQKNAERLHPST